VVKSFSSYRTECVYKVEFGRLSAPTNLKRYEPRLGAAALHTFCLVSPWPTNDTLGLAVIGDPCLGIADVDQSRLEAQENWGGESCSWMVFSALLEMTLSNGELQTRLAC